jgi:EPS-associated MarR family transcriptional regulator
MTEHHLKALRILTGNPNMSQRKIADKLNISLGNTNNIIRNLIKSGYVKMKRHKNEGQKLSYIYTVTINGENKRRKLTRELLKEKTKKQDAIKEEIKLLKHEMLNFRSIMG